GHSGDRSTVEAPCEFGLHRVVKAVLEGNKPRDASAVSLAKRLAQQSACGSCTNRRRIHIQLCQRPDATRPNVAGTEHKPVPLLLHHKVEVVDVSATEGLWDRGRRDVG